ncbi:MAG: hypothetical protein OXG16_04220 [Rhodospirillales bacterium]|nr:hypothetical protein [Rhodospirillales bacterium]
MKGRDFVNRVFGLGRERGVSVRVDTERGKGSHVTVYYGSRFTILQGRRKDIGPGLLSAMIRQPGLDRSDFRRNRKEELTMRFTYPARLQRTGVDEIVVSFRDLPECLTSGTDEAEALFEAADALEEAIAGRMNRTDVIPAPSPRRAGEHLVAAPAETAAKAALWVALRESGTSRVALAAHLGIDEKAVRRMLDPCHRSSANRIHKALRALSRDLVVETRAA